MGYELWVRKGILHGVEHVDEVCPLLLFVKVLEREYKKGYPSVSYHHEYPVVERLAHQSLEESGNSRVLEFVGDHAHHYRHRGEEAHNHVEADVVVFILERVHFRGQFPYELFEFVFRNLLKGEILERDKEAEFYQSLEKTNSPPPCLLIA